MRIDRQQAGAGERPTETGFVGDVRIAGYYRREAPSRLAGARVSFAPGARTPWKTNPLGQTLVVIAGHGRVAGDDGAVERVGPGDVIWWSPGERHWEGAAPDEAMTYIAVQEESDSSVTFGDAVSDAEYDGDASTG